MCTKFQYTHCGKAANVWLRVHAYNVSAKPDDGGAIETERGGTDSGPHVVCCSGQSDKEKF